MAMEYIKNAVVHAIITEACRRNRGDDAVIEDAIQRLREGWKSVSRNWPAEAGGKFHVVLISERPSRSFDELRAFLSAHNTDLPRGKEEVARAWRAGEISDAKLIAAICKHERLNEDGVCRVCGADRSGI